VRHHIRAERPPTSGATDFAPERERQCAPLRLIHGSPGIQSLLDDRAAAVRDVDPLLNQPPDRLTRIQKRFGVNLREKPVMAWLMQHVTWGKKGRVNTQPYIYEVDEPTVSVEGTLGRLVAKVRTPTPNRTANPRIADTSRKEWTREGTRQGRVTNAARWVGIFVERKAANEDWKPLEGDGIQNGYLPLSVGAGGGGEYEVVNDDVKEWWTYRYRARLLVKATGWTPEQRGKSDYGKEVLVVTDAGPYRLTAVEDSEVLGHKIAQHLSGAGEWLPNLASPFEGTPPAGVEVDEEEKLYLGGWSEVALQRAPSSIKLALMRVMPPVMQGQKPSAKVLLKKRVQDLQGNYHWTPVQEFTVKLGEKVGKPTVMKLEIYDNQRREIDFGTPFVLEKVDDQAVRVTAYEVKVDN